MVCSCFALQAAHFSRVQIGDKGAPQHGSRDAACGRGKREGRNWGDWGKTWWVGGKTKCGSGTGTVGEGGHGHGNGAGKSPARYSLLSLPRKCLTGQTVPQ